MSDSFPDVQAKTVRMPPAMWQALEAEAATSGVSSAELIRQSVALHLAFLAVVRSGEPATLNAILDQLARQSRDS